MGLNDIDAKSTFESTLLFRQSDPYGWKSWDLSRLTEYWIDNPTLNFGVMLWATSEDVGGYDLRFHSSDAPPPNNANPPKLEVLWSNPSKTVYFLKDHLGSIRATVDQAGTVKGYDDYDPWGYILAGRSVQTPWSNPDANSAAKNRFTGKERDDEFGVNLDYFGARYYDSEIGLWMSVDPLADYRPEESPYSYAGNNPVTRIDPDGLYWIDTDGDGKADTWVIEEPIVVEAQREPQREQNALVKWWQGLWIGSKAARATAVGIALNLLSMQSHVHPREIEKAKQKQEEGKDAIQIPEEDKIPNDQLIPPAKRGNAPISKVDGEEIEIHHVDQNPNGPFKEMTYTEHRGKGNHAKNHPRKESQIDRQKFAKQRREYWTKEWDRGRFEKK